MSDRAFTGRDVPEAVAEASRTLGVPVEKLRRGWLAEADARRKNKTTTP